MSLRTKLVSGQGSGLVASVVESSLPGLIVYPEARSKFPVLMEFRNAAGSNNMAVNGTPATQELVYDGGDTTAWNAASTGNVILNSTNQANTGLASTEWPSGSATGEARFTRPGGEAFNPSTESQFTAAIFIDTFIPGSSDFQIRLRNNGSNVTPWTDYTSVVNTGIIGAWQNIVIPFSLIGSTPDFDEVRFRKRNSNTVFFLDDIDVQTPGEDNKFELEVTTSNLNDNKITLTEFNLFISTPLDSTLSNAGLPNIISSNFGGDVGLDNGISVTSIVDVKNEAQPINTITLTDNGDIITKFSPQVQVGGDASSQWVSYSWNTTVPLAFTPNSLSGFEASVNDNLTGYERINWSAKGYINKEDIE